jgi:hypothetical protein
VFFLGTALMVTVIGMSALTVFRVKVRSLEGVNDLAAARLHAQAGIQAGIYTIQMDTNWRTGYAHNTWSAAEPIGTGTYRWKLVDEVNGGLAVDAAAPVRIYGQGNAGGSVFICSVLVQGTLDQVSSSLLTNGDFEGGTAAPWSPSGSCQLELRTDSPHGGSAYLYVKNRADINAILQHGALASMQSGVTCWAGLWMKMKDTSEGVWFGVWIRSDVGWKYHEFGEGRADTRWTYLSGAATPTWSGPFGEAVFEVGTTDTNQEFMIDDVVLLNIPNTFGTLPGTWRREAQ